MIGRGAVRNPWLSTHIKTQSQDTKWSWQQARQALLQYYHMTAPVISNPAFLLGRLKQWLAFFKVDIPEACIFFEQHKRIKSLQEFTTALTVFNDYE
jgi:tRNA-dihydrouridine synthase